MDAVGSSLFSIISSYGAISLFFILLIEESGVPLPIPGDALLLFCGFLISQGTVSLPAVVVAAFLGVLMGASILYTIGHKGGRPFIKRFGRFFLLPQTRVDTYSQIFRKHSHAAIIIGRYLPGMRVVFSFIAGLMGLPYRQFIGQVAIAASIWVCGLVGLGMYLGSRWTNASEIFQKYWYVFIIIFIVSIIGSIYKASREEKKSKPTKKPR